MNSIDKFDKNSLKHLLALVALISFGIFLVYLLHDFISPFLGAIIFSILFKGLMEKLVVKYKWKNSLSALLIIVLSFIIVLIPILVLSYMLYSKISLVVNDPHSLVNFIDLVDAKANQLFGIKLFNDATINNLKLAAGNLIPSFLNELLWILGNIAMMYFMLYYLLVERHKVKSELQSLLPFNTANILLLSNELKTMTFSNAIGVPLIGIIQGTFAGVGYYIFGVPDPFFWAVLTAFVSLLPLIGSALIWVPATLFLFATGYNWQGLGLLIYGLVVIINIDNIARFLIQKKFADVHPLITVFGVILGLDLFGLPGLIFGPLMLSYFIMFINIYRKETLPSKT